VLGWASPIIKEQLVINRANRTTNIWLLIEDIPPTNIQYLPNDRRFCSIEKTKCWQENNVTWSPLHPNSKNKMFGDGCKLAQTVMALVWF
jgi:hypothetical protein